MLLSLALAVGNRARPSSATTICAGCDVTSCNETSSNNR